jgi:hypothetical protein
VRIAGLRADPLKPFLSSSLIGYFALAFARKRHCVCDLVDHFACYLAALKVRVALSETAALNFDVTFRLGGKAADVENAISMTF